MITQEELNKLRYPVGKFKWPREVIAGKLEQWIDVIEKFPSELQDAVKNISEHELGWKYRPEGWTIRQVVHHCADSHINAIVRFKLALTEDNPTIVAYLEARWAELGDVELEIEPSMEILKGLHHRWATLLKSMEETDFNQTYFHPEHNRSISLYNTTAMYDWHCRHHLAHVLQALEFKGKFN